jgi:hypothetical protein
MPEHCVQIIYLGADTAIPWEFPGNFAGNFVRTVSTVKHTIATKPFERTGMED